MAVEKPLTVDERPTSNGSGRPSERAVSPSHGARRPGQVKALVAGGLHLRCPECSHRISSDNLQVSISFDGLGESYELYFLNPREPLDRIVDDVRRLLVTRALREARGVKSHAAQLLGMKYSTFFDLLGRLGLDDVDVDVDR